MKKLLIRLALPTFTSCVPSKTVYIVNMKDLIGLYVFGAILAFFALVFLYLWCEEKYLIWKKQKRKK